MGVGLHVGLSSPVMPASQTGDLNTSFHSFLEKWARWFGLITGPRLDVAQKRFPGGGVPRAATSVARDPPTTVRGDLWLAAAKAAIAKAAIAPTRTFGLVFVVPGSNKERRDSLEGEAAGLWEGHVEPSGAPEADEREEAEDGGLAHKVGCGEEGGRDGEVGRPVGRGGR